VTGESVKRLASLIVLLACASSAAGASNSSKSTLAILEFRAGSTAVPQIGARMAKILRKETSHTIIDPDDARRADAHIDEAVAKCDGEARCVAGLGEKLGADEVILVGVSELGDVLVLAIQRIDAKTAAVQTRAADSISHGSEPDDPAIDGYLKKLLPPADFLRYGTLRVDANLSGALVEVNGKARGTTPIQPVSLEAPQTIDVRVSKPGYVDFKVRIDVTPDATVAVRPILTRKGMVQPAWYGKWWVWTIAGAVVAGATTGGVFLLERPPSSVPVTIHF
jgi:hypothetical protein